MIHDLKPYPAMKDSGLPWLGQVPEHWEIQRGKRLFQKMNRPVNEAAETVTCFRDGIVTLRKNRRLRGFTEALKEIGYQGVQRGDLVIHAMDAFAGAIGVSDSDGKATPVYAVCTPREDADPKYYAFVTRQMAQTQWILALSRGIRERSTDFRFEAFGNQSLPVPPQDEQLAIVRFLDHADRRIRKAIAVKQKLIKLLQEQQQVIIHQAVTRGLDPNVKLRPSGVEWLGDVPEGWEVSQLRRLVRRGKKITYGIVQAGEPDPSGRFMIRGQDYSFGWASPERIFRVSNIVEAPYRRSRLRKDDILMTIVGAGVGNIASVPEWLDGANITQTTARISIEPLKSLPSYIEIALSGYIGKKNVELYVKGAAQPGLNLEHVRMFIIPIPPMHEQGEIVANVREGLSKADNALAYTHQEIALLREYRTRLIADVVTGKLDVREAATRLPELTDEVLPDELDADLDGDEAEAEGAEV